MPDGRGGYGSEQHTKIVRACEKHWDTHKDDCSGFVKAVAAELGIVLTGQANDIYDQIQSSPWSVIGRGKRASAHAVTAGITASYDGKFVVGASRKPGGNGHVAVIVEYSWAKARSVQSAAGEHGILKNRAMGYWGKLNSVGDAFREITKAWPDSDEIVFAAHEVSV